MMKEELWELLKKIPKGRVTTYGNLAKKLRTSPRAVGSMLKTNPDAPKVPCHRVVKSDGSIGGYSGGVWKKKQLLKKEGIKFSGIMDLKKYLFTL
jgi:O-6-methylguanine DNA methyltransferase